MATYVISDIHGCFDEFQQMLGKIDLSDDDRLILAGDYIDRGPKSLEMLKWLENKPANITLIKGNHDEEFAGYVSLMKQMDAKNELMTDPDSDEDAKMLLDSVRYYFNKKNPLGLLYFDYYNTITDLITKRNVTFGELVAWAEMLRGLPYYERFELGGRDTIVVHAGFCEDGALAGTDYNSPEDFWLYAREDGIEIGGVKNGMIIFGHTPTINEDSVYFNGGKVFRRHDTEKDCIFYDIDCGCVFREMYPQGTMACLRVDDEEVFYL